ncbi:MAG: CHAT domain-containing protein [Anaerolineae bacterium]|nr:CHAT domain-containing protein [Anaerolineae bacterium]MDW8102490.1 CHAT domain-containing protein [Anaerolineae bacterium]
MNQSEHPHILFLVSSPLTANPVAVDRAVHELTEALRTLYVRATFTVHIAEVEAISALMARRDRPRFSVLHYLGHGSRPEDMLEGYLIFEDQAGNTRHLNGLQLQRVLNLAGHPELEFRLAVVTSCHSESVAAALYALNIPHIVAVDVGETIRQLAAIAFLRRFYEALLTGNTVAEAFRAGQSAVMLDEDLCCLIGKEGAAAEAPKFQLFPKDRDHDEVLWPMLPEREVRVGLLPTLSRHLFDRRPLLFVGREEQMRDILHIPRERRAVLIQGVSDVGKTELAKEVARWLVARRRAEPEKVIFVDLSNISSADGARIAIANALGFWAEGIPGALPQGLLLILDEAENVILRGGRAFRDFLEALAAAPSFPCIIVTSQMDVGSAFFPRYKLRRLTPEAALALFLVEANVTQAEGGRIEAEDLEELLFYTDLIPRAVTLTARAWRYSRSPDLKALRRDLKEKWDQVMQDPYYPEEVRSVVAGISLSYSRLQERNPEVARFYPHLALFPGGFSEEGVEPNFGRQAREWVAEGEEPHVGWGISLDQALIRGGEAASLFFARYTYELPSIEAWLDWGLEHERGWEGRVCLPHLAALLQNIYALTGQLYRKEILSDTIVR